MYVTQLKDILDQEAGDEFQSVIDDFSCKDKDVENFLKNKACEYERRKKSRTYLIFGESDTPEILAYFTLSLKSLTFRSEVSKGTISKIDGFSKNVSAVALLLIGQFGKDQHRATDIQGKEFIDICLSQVRTIHNLTGGRAVLLECLPLAPIVEFYERNGFTLLQVDESDKYRQMVLLL
jgi:hypothetical protein